MTYLDPKTPLETVYEMRNAAWKLYDYFINGNKAGVSKDAILSWWGQWKEDLNFALIDVA